MNAFLAFDGDHIGRLVGRASMHDDVEGLRRISQGIDRGNRIVKSWVELAGGSMINMGGDEGRAEIPASKLGELPDIRRQYAEAVGAPVSIGIGMKLSEAEKALVAAKLHGGDRIVFYAPNVDEEIEKAKAAESGGGETDEVAKIAHAYLGKAGRNYNEDGYPQCHGCGGYHSGKQDAACEHEVKPGWQEHPKHVVKKAEDPGDLAKAVHGVHYGTRVYHAGEAPEMNHGSNGGFKAASHPVGPVKALEPSGEESSAHVEGGGEGIEMPPGPEMTHAAQGLGRNFTLEEHLQAVASQQADDDQHAGEASDQDLEQVRRQVVGALHEVRKQAPGIAELRQTNPDAYKAVMNVVQSLVTLAREVAGPDASAIQKSEEDLEKTSRNVKEQRAKIGPIEAVIRREDYARSIGLKAQRSVKMDWPGGIPRAEGNQLPWGGDFDVAHETAHAMMTPPGSTIRDYQSKLAGDGKDDFLLPDGDGEHYANGPHFYGRAQGEMPMGEPELAARYRDYAQSTHDENVASNLEYKIDRRAGVDPHRFANRQRGTGPGADKLFREAVQTPQEYPFNNWYDYHEEEGEARPKSFDEFMDSVGATKENQRSHPAEEQFEAWARQDAPHFAEKFDQGARFDDQGRVQPPTGIDATINRRAGMSGYRRVADIRRAAATRKPPLEKGGLPMPNPKAHHHLHLPAGSVVNGAEKVRHVDGSTGWKHLRSGMILSQDPSGHPVSAREPNSR